ncbi:MAG: cytidine deaminase [Chlamydiales bacterium]|jgi:cytidine deaminase
MIKFDSEKLVKFACEARENSYSPYSKFRVGAALLASSGEIFTGTNIENISYGLTICAERVACCKAVSEGVREFVAVAVVTSSSAYPCGACRQVLSEFKVPHVLICDAEGKITEELSMEELLPKNFDFLAKPLSGSKNHH